MTQVETERLLRPRATSQAAPIPVVVSDPAATAPLLPGASPASAPATTPRRRLLKCLLLGGALYASLLLFWSTSRMGLLNAANGSGAPSTFRSAVTAVVREAKELQLMRMEFLLTTTGSVDEPEARISTLVPPVREEKPTEQASTTNPKEAIARAEEHARSVKMLPDEKKKRRLKCHDANGSVLFLHRNSNKLTGEVKRKTMYHRTQAVKNLREKLLKEGINGAPDQQAIDDEVARLSLTPAPTLEPLEPDGLPDPAMWTHLLSFNTTSRRGFYKIQPYRATPQFPDWQRCYGQRELDKNQHFYAQEFADLPFSGLETHIRKFAQEAEQTRQRRVELSAR
ncbi:uncharacterized protein KRP23_4460 [Phytophthora ramorum]|uniref:uncharacterized protein n=1 Tax=Phytophthora ramorum TaxID=164328 RepID=UPI0030B3A0C9|nr:hypothetical protein KRP23_4460 [Phytophthora ramorum]